MSKKKEPAPRDPNPDIAALQAVFEAIPRSKFPLVFNEALQLEHLARRGIRAMELLSKIREWILANPDSLGGENSLFVNLIDDLIPRP